VKYGRESEGETGEWSGWPVPFTLSRNFVYPALLPLLPLMRTPRLPVVDWTDAPSDLNGLVRFAERRNLVSARVPSHFNWPLIPYRRFETTCRSRFHGSWFLIMALLCCPETSAKNYHYYLRINPEERGFRVLRNRSLKSCILSVTSRALVLAMFTVSLNEPHFRWKFYSSDGVRFVL
jgi:hypothetical protein